MATRQPKKRPKKDSGDSMRVDSRTRQIIIHSLWHDALDSGETEVAEWLELALNRPEVIDGIIESRQGTAVGLASKGTYVRRAASKGRDGTEYPPKQWHIPTCQYAMGARNISAWEGTDELPEYDKLCACIRASGTVPGGAGIETPESRKETALTLASVGNFVRKRESVDHTGLTVPPGPWHAAGCPATGKARDIREWEGKEHLDIAVDRFHKTCVTPKQHT